MKCLGCSCSSGMQTCSSPQRDSKMAAHLSWRWIVLIMYGDHLKASANCEAPSDTPSCRFNPGQTPAARKNHRLPPLTAKESTLAVHPFPLYPSICLSPTPSQTHTSFFFPSIASSLCVSHIRSAEMHPRAKSHRTTPLSQRKKLESVCPDISPAPARSEGRGKRQRERRERESERGGKRLGQRKKG